MSASEMWGLGIAGTPQERPCSGAMRLPRDLGLRAAAVSTLCVDVRVLVEQLHDLPTIFSNVSMAPMLFSACELEAGGLSIQAGPNETLNSLGVTSERISTINCRLSHTFINIRTTA